MEIAQSMNEIEQDSNPEETPSQESTAPTTDDTQEPVVEETDMPATAHTAPEETVAGEVQVEEVAAEEPAPEAKQKKRLSTGLQAAAHVKGDTLKAHGVATTRMAGESDEIPPLQEAEGEEFDPASDMPMYRPGMDWFVLRVASNKESSVRETLLRKVQIEGMETLVGRIMVPTEKTKTLKGGKQRVTETKLYPGYVFVEMRLEPDGRIPQDVFFLIKETTGVGDFVGTAGRPTPMSPGEVEKMLFDSRRPEETPQVKMEFASGDNVTIKEGPFENYEGTVDTIFPEKGLVRVLVTIFGRQAPVELEYWQIVKSEE